VDLAVAREAWLAGVDEQGLGRRFRAGGVTFCTLLPMRAIPFEVVCLLGMNDGDYPRRGSRSDFDLMGRPGHQRPGDRSRRDDDRQLMLEALLSARRVLYVSWAGRSVRDNSEQPPSVLVSQLRDYLAAGWGSAVMNARTCEHPLQPFSRRYFEASADGVGGAAGPALFSHAREWRAAHTAPAAIEGATRAAAPTAVGETGAEVPLTVATLATFLRNPVQDYFRRRLSVVFGEDEEAAGDDEPFAVTGLDEFVLMRDLIDSTLCALDAGPLADLTAVVTAQVARVHRAGRLPMAEPGRRTAQALVDNLVPMLRCWREQKARLPRRLPDQPLHFEHEALVLDDWLGGLHDAGDGSGTPAVWLELVPGRLCDDPKKKTVRADRLLVAWVRMLAASASGVAVPGVIVGRDACVTVQPWTQGPASAALADLLQTWHEGLYGSAAPLPLAPRTALALVQDVRDVAAVYEGSDHARARPGEVEEACLARLFPDYAALRADGRFETLAERLFGPLAAWVRDDVRLDLHGADEPAQAGGSAHD
jgi:exodeoxyribonuclease V gamma subunit